MTTNAIWGTIVTTPLLGELKIDGVIKKMTISLPSAYQQVIHKTRYARWREDDNRRENWDETVDRYMNYIFEATKKHTDFELDQSIKDKIRNAILETKVMPSMRGLMTAGPALERDNTCIYNCA